MVVVFVVLFFSIFHSYCYILIIVHARLLLPALGRIYTYYIQYGMVVYSLRNNRDESLIVRIA